MRRAARVDANQNEIDFQRDAYERLAIEPGLIPFRFNCGKIRGRYNAITWGRHRATSGVTDLGVQYGKQLDWVELKTGTGTRNDDQREFAEMVTEGGGRVHVARSMDDIERIIELIKAPDSMN